MGLFSKSTTRVLVKSNNYCHHNYMSVFCLCSITQNVSEIIMSSTFWVINTYIRFQHSNQPNPLKYTSLFQNAPKQVGYLGWPIVSQKSFKTRRVSMRVGMGYIFKDINYLQTETAVKERTGFYKWGGGEGGFEIFPTHSRMIDFRFSSHKMEKITIAWNFWGKSAE